MKPPCGCCAGIETVTPEPEWNRPGLTAIAYRVGTYATFFESMLARLSSFYLDVPAPDGSGATTRLYPLRRLTTRESSDPFIALLDAWATVADVLTFYQERIVNEGFLPTAVERRSVLELARLIGYRLRPGVSASVYLAFTVTNGFSGTIPAGTRAQSVPGAGQTAQFFETADDLAARDAWNNLKPRLTRPQVITLGNDGPGSQAPPFDTDTDARTRDTLYFQGTSTNLRSGDALLIVMGTGPGQQVLRSIVSVDPQADQGRTEVVLQEALPALQTTAPGTAVQQAVATLQAALGPVINEASSDFPGASLASQVGGILQQLLQDAPGAASATAVAAMVSVVVPHIQELHDIAVKRKFTRLEPWIADLLTALTALADELPSLDGGDIPPGGGATAQAATSTFATSALAGLGAILGTLALPPSLQPANSTRLVRTIPQAFSPASDVAPRLLAQFRPAVAPTLYKALANIAAPSSEVKVYAMRAKASLFGHNAPLQIQLDGDGNITGAKDWPVVEPAAGLAPAPKWHEKSNVVGLDSSYDKVLPGSWVVVQTADTTITKRQTLYAKAVSPAILSRGDYGMSGTTTMIELGSPANPSDSSQDLRWITQDESTVSFPRNNTPPDDDFQAIRQTIVYAQSEELGLAEEPLDRDVEGETIELDGVYDGLDSGRWIIVSGERTDLPNTTGVHGSELVMIAAVTQGPGKQSCLPYTTPTIPFTQVYYVTEPNAAGDRLVVGAPASLPSVFLDPVPPPTPPGSNQQICDPLQLAPAFYANAYVPTTEERTGDFSAFEGMLLDPVGNHEPFPGGQIPSTRWDPTDPGNPAPVFAWRISSVASGSDTVHTTLALANTLAYKYDSTNVTIYGNVAKATHGQTVGEVLGDGDATQAFEHFTLHQKPLTYLSAPTPAGADSTLVVRVNDLAWHEADDAAALGPTDRGYITRTDDTDQTMVLFGNGEHGARVPTGTANVKATYLYGIGETGYVDAEQISQLATHPLGAQAVINPLAATGGADRDSLDQGRRNAPVAVMALDRLVSVDDYAEFARTYAGIGKAAAARLSDGRRQLVHVTIARAGDIPIAGTSDLYNNLVQALHQFGDPHQALQVCVRKVRLLVIAAGVQILPDYPWESVEPTIRAALLDTFSFGNRELGQSAFLSEAVAVMQGVKGVSYIDVQTFDSIGEDVTAGDLAGLAGTLQRRPHVQVQLARLNTSGDLSSVTDPCQRVLPAELVFLAPDIPDTLILTQITR